jgi:hypothetical protein
VSVLRVRRFTCATVALGIEILDSLIATTPGHHECSVNTSGLLERAEQHSDTKSMEQCIEANQGLVAISEDPHEAPASTVHRMSAIY